MVRGHDAPLKACFTVLQKNTERLSISAVRALVRSDCRQKLSKNIKDMETQALSRQAEVVDLDTETI